MRILSLMKTLIFTVMGTIILVFTSLAQANPGNFGAHCTGTFIEQGSETPIEIPATIYVNNLDSFSLFPTAEMQTTDNHVNFKDDLLQSSPQIKDHMTFVNTKNDIMVGQRIATFYLHKKYYRGEAYLRKLDDHNQIVLYKANLNCSII